MRRYCDDKIPAEHRDQMRVECAVRGTSITISECRPPWKPEIGPDWTRQPVAQVRYEPSDHHWRLYCADRPRPDRDLLGIAATRDFLLHS